MNCRYRFFSGIYYLDLGQVKSTDEFKELLQKENLTFRNSDTLLILDDVYNMFKHNHSQFRWWIIDIITRYQVTILITSRNSVLEHLEDDHLMMKDIELSPLNMIESVELLLSTCKKQITLDDMGIYSDQLTVKQALNEEPQLEKCHGIPRYITILSELLEFNSFDSINITKKIPRGAGKQIIRHSIQENLDYERKKKREEKEQQKQKHTQIRRRESKKAKKERLKRQKQLEKKKHKRHFMFEEEEEEQKRIDEPREAEIQSYQPQANKLEEDFSFENATQIVQDHGGGAKVIRQGDSEIMADDSVIAVFPVEQDNRYNDHRLRADSNADDPFFKHMPSEVPKDPADLLDDDDDNDMRQDIESIEDNFYKSKHRGGMKNASSLKLQKAQSTAPNQFFRGEEEEEEFSDEPPSPLPQLEKRQLTTMTMPNEQMSEFSEAPSSSQSSAQKKVSFKQGNHSSPSVSNPSEAGSSAKRRNKKKKQNNKEKHSGRHKNRYKKTTKNKYDPTQKKRKQTNQDSD